MSERKPEFKSNELYHIVIGRTEDTPYYWKKTIDKKILFKMIVDFIALLFILGSGIGIFYSVIHSWDFLMVVSNLGVMVVFSIGTALFMILGIYNKITDILDLRKILVKFKFLGESEDD